MKIFISYKSDNRALVEELATDLDAMGHEVWFDRELQDKGGQKWWDNIIDNILSADLIVCALTPAYLDSQPCKLEYTYAKQLGKNILPIRIVEGIAFDLIPMVLQELQIIDYIAKDKHDYQALSQNIKNQPPSLPLPQPLPPPPRAPISPLAPLKAKIDEANLSLEEQTGLVHQLKSYLGNPEHDGTARLLLERLSQHPALLASVLRDIQSALQTPRPKVQPLSPLPKPPKPETPATNLPHTESPVQVPPDWLEGGEEVVKEYVFQLLEGTWKYRKVYLTNYRLRMQHGPLNFNAVEDTEIPLENIQGLRKIMKNITTPAIELKTTDGMSYVFSIDASLGMNLFHGNREEFIELVESLRE